MTTRFSPPPWRATQSSWHLRDANHTIIAEISWENKDANCALMATAPELLEALEDLLAWLEIEVVPYDLDKARSAVAKAKGEDQ